MNRFKSRCSSPEAYVTTGFSIYTSGVNDSQTDVQTGEPVWDSELYGRHQFKLGSYLDGKVLSSYAYIGYNNGFVNSRIGIDSPHIQDVIQNGWHQSKLFYWMTGGSPYIRTNYELPAEIYGFNKLTNPYSLY